MAKYSIPKSITIRNDILTAYFKDINKEKLITKEKEKELSDRIKNGDEEAVNELVKANLRFAISVAKLFQNRGLPLEDLINEANIGLIKAAKKFDADKGNRFLSYAIWWIRQSLYDAIGNDGKTVRIPMNQINSYNKINKAISQFEQEHERVPSNAELEELIEIDEEKINKIVNSSALTVSLNTPFKDDEEGTLEDVIANPNALPADHIVEKESRDKIINMALNKLPVRESDVVRMFLGLGNLERSLTLDEIARKFGVTNERARQLKNLGINILKERCSDLLKILL